MLWLASQNSRKQIPAQWNPEGGGGFSLPTSGTLYREKGKPDLEQSEGEEGELQGVRAGAQAAGSVPQRWVGRRQAARAALPAQGLGLKARMTRPCPCPHSPGPLLFSASSFCLGRLPGHRTLLLFPSPAL